MTMLCYGGHFAIMVWVHLPHYREGSLQSFISMGVVSSKMTVSSSIGHEGVTELFDEYEDDMNF